MRLSPLEKTVRSVEHLLTPTRILLTGGSGDLAQVLTPLLIARGHTVVRLDIRPPADPYGIYLPGSLLDPAVLASALAGAAGVVHIAAWHGIHEATGQRTRDEFWDLNVTGTYRLLQAAREAGVACLVNISSTSIDDLDSFYGYTKLLGEVACAAAYHLDGFQLLSLRPRAFIPWWNTAVYPSFPDWARWFWPGAVHINDVAQGVLLALDYGLGAAQVGRPQGGVPAPGSPSLPLVLPLDAAYEYTWDDLDHWDAGGPGSTFRKYYAAYEMLARRYGLDPALKPHRLDTAETERWLGYRPTYSHGSLLADLAKYNSGAKFAFI